MSEKFLLSSLPKTWVLDLDGTIMKHNGYKLDGYDTLLPEADDFLSNIRPEDMVIIVTSRKEQYAKMTEAFLSEHHIRYDYIIYNAPYGERILVNDRKLSGMTTAIAINTERDQACRVVFTIDESL